MFRFPSACRAGLRGLTSGGPAATSAGPRRHRLRAGPRLEYRDRCCTCGGVRFHSAEHSAVRGGVFCGTVRSPMRSLARPSRPYCARCAQRASAEIVRARNPIPVRQFRASVRYAGAMRAGSCAQTRRSRATRQVGRIEVIAMNERVVHDNRVATPSRVPAPPPHPPHPPPKKKPMRIPGPQPNQTPALYGRWPVPSRIGIIERRPPDPCRVVDRHVNHVGVDRLDLDSGWPDPLARWWSPVPAPWTAVCRPVAPSGAPGLHPSLPPVAPGRHCPDSSST